jgi:SWIM/SEC-C metal-binding protein
MKRAEEIIAVCNERGWMVIVGLEPDKPEDTSDFERLLHPPEPIRTQVEISRNAACPCGSGKKYKRCCGRKQAPNRDAREVVESRNREEK